MDSKKNSTERPPLWADLLLTLWIILIAVIYFGGYFLPALGVWTSKAALFYALMLLISAATIYLKSRPAISKESSVTPKK